MNEASIITAAKAAFILAAAAVAGMLLLMLSRADGAAAIAVIAGLPQEATVSETSLRFAIFCDTLLPVGYSCGLILLAFSRMGSRFLLAGCVVLFTVTGAVTDFFENGVVLAGNPIPSLTIAKFGTLAIASFFLGVLVYSAATLDRLVAMVLMFGVPAFMALLVSGLLGQVAVWIFAPSLIGTFLLGAAVARDDTLASERASA